MTEELENKINKCKTLDELFNLWKQAHKDEENFFKTFPKCSCCGGVPNENFKESFCKDGITSLNGNVNKDKTITEDVKVLFVLKESNCGGHKVNDEFWFNDCVGNKERNDYKERLEDALKYFNFVNPNAYFGYMNLNKRGGYGSTNSKQLEAYTLEYYTFIKKEIEILSPDYIIFCGCFDVFVESCKEKDNNEKNQNLHNWNYYKKRINHTDFKKPEFKYGDNQSAYIAYICHPASKKNDFDNSLNILGILINKK